jgi:hypothetical protein
MSNKFKIDASKFIFNDEYVENDIDILENVSIIRQEEESKEEESKEEPELQQELNDINLNSNDTNPKD